MREGQQSVERLNFPFFLWWPSSLLLTVTAAGSKHGNPSIGRTRWLTRWRRPRSKTLISSGTSRVHVTRARSGAERGRRIPSCSCRRDLISRNLSCLQGFLFALS